MKNPVRSQKAPSFPFVLASIMTTAMEESRVITGLLLLVYVFSLQSCKTNPAGSGNANGAFVDKISFASWVPQPTITVADLYDNDGALMLYSINPVAPGEGSSLSPDEQWIAYVDYHGHLMETKVDGSDEHEISFRDSIYVDQVCYSPDGNSFAVTCMESWGLGNTQLLAVCSRNGSNLRVLYDRLGYSTCPGWSPDGKTVYFSWYDSHDILQHNQGLNNCYIMAIDTNGTNLRFISDSTGTYMNDMGCISPDGAQVAFASMRNHPGQAIEELFIMSSHGTGVRELTECACQGSSGSPTVYTQDYYPRWTRSGKFILFERHTWISDSTLAGLLPDKIDVYAIKPDGTDMQNLTNDNTSSLSKKN